jgi:sugar O-acyltransferase (sialic acid O-acetyltransferase NeuD family)
MKKEIILFGTGKIAEVIHYYALQLHGLRVSAFTVDSRYIKEERFLGLPVIPFEEIEKNYSPKEFEMFIAVGYHDLNRLREQKCNEAEKKGFRLTSIVATDLPKNVTYGKNCFIMPPSIIHPCVEIGNNVFIWSGAMIGHHSLVGDNCWLTSSCNIGGNVRLGKNTFVAVNATVGHSVSVGEKCFLGANTLLTRNLDNMGVLVAESSKPFRLNSEQFLRFSQFSNL